MTREVIAACEAEFARYRTLAEGAAEQLTWEQLRTSLDAETNSIAVVMKHVGGNLKSRWTDPLTTDGEKLWRNRDGEFVDDLKSREELAAIWSAGLERAGAIPSVVHRCRPCKADCDPRRAAHAGPCPDALSFAHRLSRRADRADGPGDGVAVGHAVANALHPARWIGGVQSAIGLRPCETAPCGTRIIRTGMIWYEY
jgi:hypothetical protein